MSTSEATTRTALYHWHIEQGAKMAAFAGYEMPISYPPGTLAEHAHCRTSAAMFDVAHMGVVEFYGERAAATLESIVPASIVDLPLGKSRYTLLTNEAGGVIDDLIITNLGSQFMAVVNASRRTDDLAHLRKHLEAFGVEVRERSDLGLLALQGPKAADVMDRLAPGVTELRAMQARMNVRLGELLVTITRSGYTGEDGFEIVAPAESLDTLARLLGAQPEVAPAGLGARDTLRLEAGLCLYGNDLDETTTPVEANLTWTIQKRRRELGGFIGDDIILRQLATSPQRRRVGLAAEGRRPTRHGDIIRTVGGTDVGIVTSGTFGPTFGAPVAMGYVASSVAAVGTELIAEVRGSEVAVTVVELPFVGHRYVR